GFCSSASARPPYQSTAPRSSLSGLARPPSCHSRSMPICSGTPPEKFKELADATRLPESRRASCQGDYSNASWSWSKALDPHRRSAGQPKAEIETLYGRGEGKFDVYARSFHSIRLLETVAEVAADRWVWPRAFTLEMQGCGEPDARWRFASRKLTLCYEMAAEFAELYRD